MGILRKFQQYRRLPQDPPPGPPHHLEEELDRLTGKIVRISPPAPPCASGHQVTFCCQDSLLFKIEGQDQEAARAHEEECVVCGTNRASMQTLPCSHQVIRGDILILNGGHSNILIYILTLPCRWCVGNASSAPSKWP